MQQYEQYKQQSQQKKQGQQKVMKWSVRPSGCGVKMISDLLYDF